MFFVWSILLKISTLLRIGCPMAWYTVFLHSCGRSGVIPEKGSSLGGARAYTGGWCRSLSSIKTGHAVVVVSLP